MRSCWGRKPKRFPKRIHHTQRLEKVMMMTTSVSEGFIILSRRKTMPALLIQTTVCQHNDDGDDFGENDDTFDDHDKVF